MLVMNQCGMNRLLSDKFTIGGEASAAPGPLGRQTSANTDILLHGDILSWSRSRGLFAGLSLEGATLRPDTEENGKLYGKDVTNKQILQAEVASPKAGWPLVATRITGMYGPPQRCKRKTKNDRWSAPMYSALSGVSDSGP
jgi:lipid-binding SYLF domain-containing protein